MATSMPTAKDRAAKEWYGYGRWDAPYWFVGMEPGGSDEGDISYASWDALGAGDLLDCKMHHDEWNRRGGTPRARWHEERPPVQSTWGPLIKTLLAFADGDTSTASVRNYQRDRWGMSGGETAVLELSALHARSVRSDVNRTIHRDERIDALRMRLVEHQPVFALFYGATYREQYARIAGRFNEYGWCWNGRTLCVLVQHPAYRFAPRREFWTSLGAWMRQAVQAGPNAALPACPQPVSRRGMRPKHWLDTVTSGTIIPIMRDGHHVGRITYDGRNLFVEATAADGTHRALGYYERARATTVTRKIDEIDAIFDTWSDLAITDAYKVKANWRRADVVAGFAPPEGALAIGCTVLEQDGADLAKIYKILPTGAILVPTKHAGA